MSLIQQNGRIAPALVELCRKYGIDAPSDISARELNERLQQKWFKEGYLRFQIKGEPPKHDDLELLRDLGCIDEVRPDFRIAMSDPLFGLTPLIYRGALLLGALRARVVSRLYYLTNVVSGLFFDPAWLVYLMGGARPLDPVKESREALCTPVELPFKKGWTPPEQMPATEAEMMELVWQQSGLSFLWRRELVNAPLQPKDPKNPEGEKRPPNTGDTTREWLTACRPRPGCYLALSNQPFVKYQELTLRRLVPSGFTIFACGPQASSALPLPTFLDNIAKQFYEELLMADKLKAKVAEKKPEGTNYLYPSTRSDRDFASFYYLGYP